MIAPIEHIARVLRTEDDFLITSHLNPDGDALGSMAALGFVLARMGKRFVLYNASGLPVDFDWLTLPAPVTDTLPTRNGQWTVTLDCGDLGRAGRQLAQHAEPQRLINIDHHLGNPEFGAINWVDTAMSSTGEMIARLAAELGFVPDGALGEAVYLALVTDTGYFSYDNTTPATMALAAEIMRLGLKPGPFNANVQNQYTLERVKLTSEVLSKARLTNNGSVGLISISAEDMRTTNTTPADTDGLINTIRRVKGVKVSISLREDAPGQIKFSLRSSGDVNVQPVAAHFGGGGHKNASGGMISAPLDVAERKMLKAVDELVFGRDASPARVKA